MSKSPSERARKTRRTLSSPPHPFLLFGGEREERRRKKSHKKKEKREEREKRETEERESGGALRREREREREREKERRERRERERKEMKGVGCKGMRASATGRVVSRASSMVSSTRERRSRVYQSLSSTKGRKLVTSVRRLRAQENEDVSWAAADSEEVDMKNIEVVNAGEEEEDYESGPDLEEVIYSLDKSASVASLLSVIEQKFADQLDPAFLDDGIDGEDYEKHAENMRNEVKALRMEERLIEVRRVTKVVKGGNILSFRAIVAVGNKKGKIAVGVGKGKEVMPATTKAVAEALRDIVEFPIAKNDSIPHTTVGSATSASVILKPAGEGTGVIAGGATRTVLELAGVENVLSKQLGSDSLLNNARATVNALAKLRSPAQVAKLRGKTVRQLFGLDDVTKKVDTVEVSADRLQELINSCDTKTQTEINEGLSFLKTKGLETEGAEAKVVEKA